MIAVVFAASAGAVSVVAITIVILFCTKKTSRKSNDDADALPAPITSPDIILFETGQGGITNKPSFVVPSMGASLNSPNDIHIQIIPTLSPPALHYGDASTHDVHISLDNDNQYSDSAKTEDDYLNSPAKLPYKQFQTHVQRNRNNQFNRMDPQYPSRPYDDVDDLEAYIDD